jgi:hypothetical protein
MSGAGHERNSEGEGESVFAKQWQLLRMSPSSSLLSGFEERNQKESTETFESATATATTAASAPCPGAPVI